MIRMCLILMTYILLAFVSGEKVSYFESNEEDLQ